jgi:hypothetical protein
MLLACDRAPGAARFWVSLRRPRDRQIRRCRDTGLGLPTTLRSRATGQSLLDNSAGGGAQGSLTHTRARGPIGWYAPGWGRQAGVRPHAWSPWSVTAVRGEVGAVASRWEDRSDAWPP